MLEAHMPTITNNDRSPKSGKAVTKEWERPGSGVICLLSFREAALTIAGTDRSRDRPGCKFSAKLKPAKPNGSLRIRLPDR
jgi:hypothetical protein